MRLIVSEKDNAARRIAEILSDGSASADRRGGVNVYGWDDTRVVGLSGHVVGVDFPEEYSNWNDVDPAELVTAEIVKTPSREDIVNTLKRLARGVDRVTIATDYDREGELIGKEAYELVREVDDSVPIDRVRFSSITEREVKSAFDDPDELDFNLAAAGEARQIIDLMWGAALTRYLSLAAKQYGDDFISVGRVQSPTLKLIVDREREIEAFEPDDYWELFAELAKNGDVFEAQYYYLDRDDNEAERVWSEADADAAYDVLEAVTTATVTEVDRRTRTDRPPAPFNTTQFIRAAGAIGFSAKRAMSIAEDLYTAGYITYPRTDNTVYPADLDPAELLATFANTRQFGEDAAGLLDGEISPTRGDEETTDHPPIHPTFDVPNKGDLSDAEYRVYELVVRRFFATVADPAVWEHLRVVVDAGGLSLKANGKRLAEPGYHAVYPYFSTDENYVPDVDVGEELTVEDTRMEAKQTQPPRRYGQSRLIETMEEMGIGTKCLTGDTKVLVRDDDGDVHRQPVASLFEEEQVVMADGDTDVAVTQDGPTTLSFEEGTAALVERDQTLVSRRPLSDDERVFEVVTNSGSFSATGDHPVYVQDDGRVRVKPVSELHRGDELLATRHLPSTEIETNETVVSWEEFAAFCDKDTKLYGTNRNESVRDIRADVGEARDGCAERFRTHHDGLWTFENHQRNVPLWLLGGLGKPPEEIHALNAIDGVENPFPLTWSPALVRILANLGGDGSISFDEEENTMDIRYRNTDSRVIDRFVSDIETVFGIELGFSSRPGREGHRQRKHQLKLPSGLAGVLLLVLESVMVDGAPRIPQSLKPVYLGALFDDEGHVPTDGEPFISNTDHDRLLAVKRLLEEMNIATRIAEHQHKLYVRGRRDLERFLDTVPIAADEKFYRGLSRLRHHEVTNRKAKILEILSERAATAEDLAAALGVGVSVVRSAIRELDADGYIESHIEGRSHSHDGNRIFRYSTDKFEESVYSTLRNQPATVTALEITEREYDGYVYDLTIDESAPNFAVEGGAIVHNSTRHETVDKLYDRGYIEDNPPRPTQLARGVVEAAEEYADMVVSDAMTAELEADMAAIANGEKTLDEVTQESREMLESVFEALEGAEEAIGEHIRERLKQDKALGPCPECGERLLVRKSRYGSFFVGCDGYPDCEFTLPLPNRGEPQVLSETCEEHELRHVKMLAGRSTFTHGCPQCQADEADAEEDRVIGACPDCGDADGGDLAIKRVRSGSRLVGCTRYPDCDYSLPLPRRGDIEVTDDRCEEHDLPELVVHSGDEPWELGCPICNFETYQEEQANSLQSVKGIGKKTAQKLEDAGISTVDELKAADPDDVAGSVEGVSASQVRTWKTNAEA